MRPDTLDEPADQFHPVSGLNPVALEKFRGGGQLFGAAEASNRPLFRWGETAVESVRTFPERRLATRIAGIVTVVVMVLACACALATPQAQTTMTVTGTLARAMAIGGESTGWSIQVDPEIAVDGKPVHSIEISYKDAQKLDERQARESDGRAHA